MKWLRRYLEESSPTRCCQLTLVASDPLKDAAFYEVAAQVIPVLLLGIVIELRLYKISDDEGVGDSLWIVGAIGTMFVGELTAVGALFGGQSPSQIEKAVILIAIFYGVMLFAVLPVAPRIRALRELVPGWLWSILENVVVFGVIAIGLLATFGVVSSRVIGAMAATAALGFIVLGRLIDVLGPGKNKSGNDI